MYNIILILCLVLLPAAVSFRLCMLIRCFHGLQYALYLLTVSPDYYYDDYYFHSVRRIQFSVMFLCRIIIFCPLLPSPSIL